MREHQQETTETKCKQKYLFLFSICDHELLLLMTYSTNISVHLLANLFLLSYYAYLFAQSFLLSVLIGPLNCQPRCLATQVETTISLLGTWIFSCVFQRGKLLRPEAL